MKIIQYPLYLSFVVKYDGNFSCFFLRSVILRKIALKKIGMFVFPVSLYSSGGAWPVSENYVIFQVIIIVIARKELQELKELLEDVLCRT